MSDDKILDILSKPYDDRTPYEHLLLLQRDFDSLLDRLHIIDCTLTGVMSQNRIVIEDNKQMVERLDFCYRTIMRNYSKLLS